MKHQFNVTLTKEDDIFVAQCLEVDLASQGPTESEALELHFEPPCATELPTVKTVEIDLHAA